MTLKEAHGKDVRVLMLDGEIFEGRAYDYTSALDNEPDPESITIDSIELYAPEIFRIELLEQKD